VLVIAMVASKNAISAPHAWNKVKREKLTAVGSLVLTCRNHSGWLFLLVAASFARFGLQGAK
jgi:hypothetical protein